MAMSNKLFTFPYMPPGRAMPDCRRMSQLKLFRQALKDTSYPIIHIDPNYLSLKEDPDPSVPIDKKYEKRDLNRPFLKSNMEYETLGSNVTYKRVLSSREPVNPPTTKGYLSNVVVVEMIYSFDNVIQKHLLVYDVTETASPGEVYHPIAVIKDVDKNVTVSRNAVFCSFKGKPYKFFYFFNDTDIKSLPISETFASSKLDLKHFMFSGSPGKDEKAAAFEEQTIPRMQNNTIQFQTYLLSVAVNLSRTRTINPKIGDGGTRIDMSHCTYEQLSDRILTCASAQSAIYETALQKPGYDSGVNDVFASLTSFFANKDADTFAYCHVYLVWCVLYAYYARAYGMEIYSEEAAFQTRRRIQHAILTDLTWVKTTKTYLEITGTGVANVLLDLIMATTTVDINANPAAYKSFSDSILQKVKISIDKATFAHIGLDGPESNFARAFTTQIDNCAKIWSATGMTGVYSVPETTQLSSKIAVAPFYAGGYAAEIDRIAKAIATGEVACVPQFKFDDQKISGYICKHGTSLSAVPPLSHNHAHPVAEYFNEGVVVILVHLLRLGHTIRTVPYLQKVTPPPGDTKYPWALSPAIEITFTSGRQYYHPANIIWLDAGSMTVNVDRKTKDGTSLQAFARRLLKRSSMLSFLPALAIVSLDEKGKVVCARSHGDNVPPIAVIILGAQDSLQIVGTLYRTGLTLLGQPARNAAIDTCLNSKFDGFCPQLWRYSAPPAATSATSKACMMELICLGMDPADAKKGITGSDDMYNSLLTDKELFGVPSLDV
jgi:hypothetical protein